MDGLLPFAICNYKKGEIFILDNRLTAVVSLLRDRKPVFDIGTDHGYIPVYVSKKSVKTYAADINEKPLKAALFNIRKHGSDAEIIFSDGLLSIDSALLFDCEIIIAGMGGEQISKILFDAKNINKINKSQHFILQPMTKDEHLRRYLYANGFYIENEIYVKDKYVYVIMSVYFTENNANPLEDELFYYAGMSVKRDDALSKEYKQMVANRLSDRVKAFGKDSEEYCYLTDIIQNITS